jgi:hypothetical protein
LNFVAIGFWEKISTPLDGFKKNAVYNITVIPLALSPANKLGAWQFIGD